VGVARHFCRERKYVYEKSNVTRAAMREGVSHKPL
jgi:hypothetical protein